ncbi:MAG: HAD family hydrolase [Intestinimonas sp.]
MKTILLDMDGVLLDSEMVRLAYIRRFLKQQGIEVQAEALLDLSGVSNRDAARRLARRFELPLLRPPAKAALARTCRGLYLEAEGLRPFPGLEHFLRTVKERGAKTGLVSSTQCREVLDALNRFSLLPLFDVVLGGESAPRRKPAPDPYLHAARFLRARPEDCMVVEDSPPGILAGKRAGCLWSD